MRESEVIIAQKKPIETGVDYEIIQSGSSGNAVFLDDYKILVDCGVPFSKIKPYLYKTKYLFITHVHTDHLRVTTYNSIRKNFPRIKTMGNWQVHQAVGVDVITSNTLPIGFKDYEFTFFECPHFGVECQGMVTEFGRNPDGSKKRVIYATDTSTMEFAPPPPYDLMLIESNYDEVKIKMAKSVKGYDPKINAMRHLSKKSSRDFYLLNRRSVLSEHVELHKSQRFY